MTTEMAGAQMTIGPEAVEATESQSAHDTAEEDIGTVTETAIAIHAKVGMVLEMTTGNGHTTGTRTTNRDTNDGTSEDRLNSNPTYHHSFAYLVSEEPCHSEAPGQSLDYYEVQKTDRGITKISSSQP
jgi:hypothetical protein